MNTAQSTTLAQGPGKGETKGGRRPTAVSPFPGARSDHSSPSESDTEVQETIPRRHFTAEFKLRILQEVDACSEHGQIGALLRREGLYYSHLRDWRELRDQGAFDALNRKRGRKVKQKRELAGQIASLERENRRLEDELRKARIIIEYQKKMADLLSPAKEELTPCR